ncbi:MAG: AMP-binding protein [Gammaproteobacteria bacterium]|nr:AMP-binding protein [Gammaproteobacteria bacterium]
MTELLANARPSGGTASDDAIGAPGRTALSYAGLESQVRAVGRQLRGAGVSATDRVAIVLPNGPLAASAFVSMAPWCATAPLNPAYKESEFEFYLDDLDARALVVEAGSKSPAVEVAEARGIRVISLRECERAGEFALADAPETAVTERDADATALILHTSGTTSRPKMVPLSQANLCASATNIVATLALSPSDRCLNVMPLFHIHGLVAPVLATLAAGASVSCSPGFDALRFFSWLAEAQPTWYSAVPTMHQAILARAGRNEDTVRASVLRFIRSSSASLPPQVMQQLEAVFAVPVIEAYAMTEAAHQMCSNPLPPKARKPGSVGPAAGPEVTIMDAKGTALGTGEEGEIVIRGANVTTGYLNNPEANAGAFHVSGWFRTGDQGVMDADGYVKVTGRLKEIINRGGEKIAPLEIDEVLLDHQAVQQVCAFAAPHPKLGEDVAAAVVLADGASASERDLRDFAAERLADFKVPRRILFVDEIPKGPTGKIQRIGLAKALGIEA